MDDRELEVTKKDLEQVYGTFILGNAEYAISACNLQEVVDAPTEYTELPLSHQYVKGLFNLRGNVMPVVDMKALLNQKMQYTDEAKLAVVNYSGHCVGLLFDGTGKVFAGNSRTLDLYDRDQSDSLLMGVFKNNLNTKLIQLIDVENILALRCLPKNKVENSCGSSTFEKRKEEKVRCISFKVGSTTCAFQIDQIREVVKPIEIAKSELVDDLSLGMINLRGTTVPLVDFSVLLGYSNQQLSRSRDLSDANAIVMEIEGYLIGFLIGKMDDIFYHAKANVLRFTTMVKERTNAFEGLLPREEKGEVLLLNPEGLLNRQEISSIAKRHSDLYREDNNSEKGIKKKTHLRELHLVFTCMQQFVIDMSSILEIIEKPEQLLLPPNLRKDVVGVYNLRGRLISVLDLRSLLGLPKQSNIATKPKIVICSVLDNDYGLVVDGINEIIQFSEEDKMDMPSSLFAVENALQKVTKTIRVTFKNGDEKNLLVLNVERLLSTFVESRTLTA